MCYEEFIPRLGSFKMASLYTETLGAGTRMLCGIHCVVHKRQLINGEIVHGARCVEHDSFNLYLHDSQYLQLYKAKW